MPSKSKTNKKTQGKSKLRKTLIRSVVANSVKRELSKRVEVKTVAPAILTSNRITNHLYDPSVQCIPLVPIIAQGAGQGERIGNKVRTRKATLNINMNVDSITIASGYVPPMYIDVYIYKVRKSNNVTAVPLDQFLQYGNTSTDYDSASLFQSGNLNINRDQILLKRKKRVLLTNKAESNQTGLALVNGSNINNAHNMTVDITKFLAKNMNFQDAVTNTPEDNLYVSVVATPNDYNTLYAQNFVFGQFSTMVQYSYEDL